MKLFTLILFYLSTICTLFSQSTQFEWVSTLGGGESNDIPRSVTVDNIGNVYATGAFSDYADFDPGLGEYLLTSIDETDAYIWKLDSLGGLVWARQFGGGEVQGGTDIKIDALGNVYSIGVFSETTDFDPGLDSFNLTSLENTVSTYISKLDESGSLIWAKQLGGEGSVVSWSMDLDAESNIYLTGTFLNTIDFDPSSEEFNLTSAGGKDVFICKLDKDGNFIWAKQIEGMNSSDESWGLDLDDDNNIYITGRFWDTVDFNPGTEVFLLSAEFDRIDPFVLKLDENGDFVWARDFDTLEGISSIPWDVAVDGAGNVFTTGCVATLADFDPGLDTFYLGGNGLFNGVFVSKLDTEGNFAWAKSFSEAFSGGGGYGKGLATDEDGNIYITGYMSGILDFDPGLEAHYLTSTVGSIDIFIAKLDAAGNFVWAGNMWGSLWDEGYDITVDAQGNIYSCGFFSSNTDFDLGPGIYQVSPQAFWDGYVHKMSQPCQLTTNLSGNLNLCSGDSTTLTTKLGYSYNWSTGDTTSSITISPLATTTYTVTLSDGQGCSISSYAEVVVHPSPEVNITNSSADLCQGDSSILLATGGGSYIWNTGETTDSLVIFPDVNTNYTVTVTSNEDCTANGTIDINVYSYPTANISGDLELCQNETSFLTASEGQNYLWNTGDTTSAISIFPDENTMYTVTVTNGLYCSVIDSVLVQVINIDTSLFVSNITITSGAGNASNYQWLDCNNNYAAIPNAEGPSFTAVENGSYALEITEDGCLDTTACQTIIVTGIIENNFGSEILVYPNPTKNMLTIDLGAYYEELKLNVYNVLGQVVLTEKYEKITILEFEMPEVAGYYMVFFQGKNGERGVVKVFKE